MVMCLNDVMLQSKLSGLGHSLDLPNSSSREFYTGSSGTAGKSSSSSDLVKTDLPSATGGSISSRLKPDLPLSASYGKEELSGRKSSEKLFQRCESFPGVRSSSAAGGPGAVRSLPPAQFRMPGPGYWPMQYDMRAAWANYQYHSYMMLNDPYYAAQHQHQQQQQATPEQTSGEPSILYLFYHLFSC